MRNLIWVFAALVVVSGVISTNLWRDLRGERELAASLQTQLDEVAQLPAAMPSAPAAQVAPSTPAAQPATATPANQPAPVVAKAAPANAANSVLIDMEKQQRELMKDPEYRKLRLAQLRTSVAGNNAGLAEELGLTQAEADKVLDLLAEQELNASLDSMFVTTANDPAALQEMLRKQQEYQRQRDEKVAALLGPGKAGQWQQYQQDAPTRNRVLSINRMLVQGNQPLSAGQQKALASVLTTELRSLNAEMAVLTRDITTMDPATRTRVEETARRAQDESSQRILVAAAPILSAAQLAVVRAQFEQQSAMSRAAMRARERAMALQAQGAP